MTWIYSHHEDGSWMVYDDENTGRVIGPFFDGRDAQAIVAHRRGAHAKYFLARCEDCQAERTNREGAS